MTLKGSSGPQPGNSRFKNHMPAAPAEPIQPLKISLSTRVKK
jgi:hypothetical protein